MYSQIESYSPSRAKHYLDTCNRNNRPINRERVRLYAAEMTAGRWRLNPQGIAFDRSGQLLNGQHTLAAVVASGVTLDLYTHHQVLPDAQGVMDQGLPRTAAQIFAMETGAPGAARFTSAARAVLEHGMEVKKPSNLQIVAWAQEHLPALERYAELGKLYTAGTHAAFVFAENLGLKGVEEAGARLATLKWDGDSDPMRALARALGQMGGRDGAKAKLTRFHTTLQALQAVSAGEGLEVVRKRDTLPPRVRDSIRVMALA